MVTFRAALLVHFFFSLSLMLRSFRSFLIPRVVFGQAPDRPNERLDFSALNTSGVSKLDSSPEPAAALPPTNGRIRYRSSSATELSTAAGSSEGRTRQRLPSTSVPRLEARRRSGLVLVFVASLLVVSFVLLFTPRSSEHIVDGLGRTRSAGGRDEGSKSYAVVFDAGSSGSRVHVYCFDDNLDLVRIGKEIELFEQKTPGLSFYAKEPQEAANSLISLLEKAESIVPENLRQKTPVRVGATAGLRSLGQDTSEQILQAVRDLMQKQTSLKFQPDWVTVLDGTQEGAYQWVAINYLLGQLGKAYSNTVGVVDLGGGSVQMAYAISEENAQNAPKLLEGEDLYVQKLLLKGTIYYLYVHSYLHYGLLAARAEILKVADDYSHCILSGHNGSYRYGENEYKASTSASGANFFKCRTDAVKALKVDEPACTHMKCTFGGVWNGGGGDGQKNLFVASFFFDRAAEAGFINHNMPVVKVIPADFEEAAKHACKLSVEDAKTTYPRVQEGNLPYLCMDLVYQYTLLVDGFGLDPYQEITLVKQVQYGDAFVEAAWPLGSAIEVASTQETKY